MQTLPGRARLTAIFAALIALAGVHCNSESGGAAGDFEPFARAFRVTDRNQLIGGPKAVATVGDLILENDRIRVAVVGSVESFGPGLYGGALVDADFQRPDGSTTGARGKDELVEIFPILDLAVQRLFESGGISEAGQPLAKDVSVIEGGGSGHAARAVVRMEAEITGLITLVNIAGPIAVPDVRLIQDYILEPGQSYLTIRSDLRFGETGPGEGRHFELDYGRVPDTLPTLIFSQGVGDIAVLGGTLFSPDFGFDSTGALFSAPDENGRFDEQAPFRDTFADPLTGEFLASVGNERSYGVTIPRGRIRIPLVASTITPQYYGSGITSVDIQTGQQAPFPIPRGSVLTYERYVIVGEGDIASIRDVVHEVRGEPTGLIRGQVVEEATAHPQPGASVLLFAQKDGIDPANPDLRSLGVPVSQFTADIRLDDSIDDGSFEGLVPPGDYWLMGLTAGHGRSHLVPITVVEGQTTRALVQLPRDGSVTVSVLDAARDGNPIPAKVTVVELDGNGVPWARFGEGRMPLSRVTREGAIFEPQFVDAADTSLEFVVAYKHTETGATEFDLAPGRYRVLASRGYEYSIDSKEITVQPGLAGHVDLAIAQVVDTNEWLSIDTHVHSIGSHDSSCSTEDRVRGYAAEHVEILTSTDHDFVTNYAPDLENLGLQEHLKTIVGDELTTFEVGHFIGFPLEFDARLNSNGAPGWLATPPPVIAELLEERGTLGPQQTVTMLNHPRDGILGMFSQFGFDQGTGEFCEGLFTLGNPILRNGAAGLGSANTANFCLDCFTAVEVLNGTILQEIRTPTIDEVPLVNVDPDKPDLPRTTLYEVLSRTMEEQRRILDPNDPFGVGDQGRYQGGVDDFFMMLNFGARVTGMGTSDTHHCDDAADGRSWIHTDTDLPSAASDADVARSVISGDVTMGFGPFVTFTINGVGLGGTVIEPDGIVELDIRVQGADWFEVDRIEIYGNGELVREISIPTPNLGTEKYRGTTTIDVRELSINDGDRRDTHFIVIALGDDDLFPVNFPKDLPSQDIAQILSPLLGPITGAGPEPMQPGTYNFIPYSVTNPIFVDTDGDGVFQAIGRPPADGQFKLPPCNGTMTPQECACLTLGEDEETAGTTNARAAQAQAYGRWIHTLDQIHGRLKAVKEGTEYRNYP